MTVVVRGYGPAVSNSTGAPLVVSTPARSPGDIVLIAVIVGIPNDPVGLSPSIAEVSADHGMASLRFVGDTKNRLRLLGGVVDITDDGAPITITRTAGLDTGSDTIFSAKAVVLGGVMSGLGGLAFSAGAGTYTAASGAVPAMAATTVDDLTLMFGLSITQITNGIPPSGYVAGATEVMGSGLGASFAIYTAGGNAAGIPASASTFAAAGTNGRYGFIGVSFHGTTTPLVPASSAVAKFALGCAERYHAFITYTDTTSATLEDKIVDEVGWQSISWNRVLDDISTANVVIPDRYQGVFCCAALGGLVPWRFGLRIERNAELVWKGPIVDVSRPTNDGRAVNTLRVEAQDIWSRFRKRLVSSYSYSMNNIDAGDAWSRVRTSSTLSPAVVNGFVLPHPLVEVGFGITREIVAREFDYAWDILKELLDSALDGYIMNGVEYLFQRGEGWKYNDGTGGPDAAFEGPTDATSGELLYGLFTESAWKERPGWSISGLAQANRAWEPGADSGEEGARRFWTAFNEVSIGEIGVLDIVDPNPLYRSADDGVVISDGAFQQRADSLIQQRAAPPAVISGGALADDAPIDMENLRPGGIWRCDISDACFGQLLQNARLKRVQVDVTMGSEGLEETVAPTLFPVGYTEAMLE